MTPLLGVRGDEGIAPYEITGGACVYISGGQSRPPLHTPIENLLPTTQKEPP